MTVARNLVIAQLIVGFLLFCCCIGEYFVGYPARIRFVIWGGILVSRIGGLSNVIPCAQGLECVFNLGVNSGYGIRVKVGTLSIK